MALKKGDLNFEQSLKSLQDLVAKLEGGDLSLEQSVTLFEEGMRLTTICNHFLANAEQKVKVLLEKNGQLVKQDFTQNLESNNNVDDGFIPF